MSSFDYVGAWEKVVNPQVVAMPRDMFELYSRTVVEAEELSQMDSLEMPWPSEEFKAAFELVDTDKLAKASRAIYFWGHWSSAGHARIGNGGAWKFSNYADQVLRDRFGLGRDGKITSRYGMEIHEGVLRVTYSTPDEWSWEEVDTPIKELIDFIRGYCSVNPAFEECIRMCKARVQGHSWFKRFQEEVDVFKT